MFNVCGQAYVYVILLHMVTRHHKMVQMCSVRCAKQHGQHGQSWPSTEVLKFHLSMVYCFSKVWHGQNFLGPGHCNTAHKGSCLSQDIYWHSESQGWGKLAKLFSNKCWLFSSIRSLINIHVPMFVWFKFVKSYQSLSFWPCKQLQSD